jgi:hypothetical protein
MFKVGTNIVTETYRMGAERLVRGENPYAPPRPGADRFEYSPAFALLYAPLQHLPSKWQAFAWAAFNCALFWLGIGAWFCWRRGESAWLVAAVLVCAMELNISVLYQQTNAALIGLTLLGLAAFRDEKFFRAGLLLAIATELKLLPGIFAFALMFSRNRSYWFGLGVGGLLAFLAPALMVGWTKNLALHQAWIHDLFETMKMVRPGQLDLVSVLGRWGVGNLAIILKWIVVAVSMGLLFTASANRRISWEPWIAIGVSCLLLVSPRSESPTFVLVAPAYILLTAFFIRDSRSPWAKTVGLVLLALIAFFITVAFTDLWARKSWAFIDVGYPAKTLGTALLWLLAILVLAREWLTDHTQPIFLRRGH